MAKYVTLIAAALLVACNSRQSDEPPAAGDQTTQPEPTEGPVGGTGDGQINVDEEAGSGSATAEPDDDPLAVDHSRPDTVVSAIFATVEDGQLDRLHGLCDPMGEANDRARELCAMTYDDKGAFLTLFEAGRVAGPAVLARDGHTAEVPIMYGRDGKTAATVVVVQRPEGWFLQSY